MHASPLPTAIQTVRMTNVHTKQLTYRHRQTCLLQNIKQQNEKQLKRVTRLFSRRLVALLFCVTTEFLGCHYATTTIQMQQQTLYFVTASFYGFTTWPSCF